MLNNAYQVHETPQGVDTLSISYAQQGLLNRLLDVFTSMLLRPDCARGGLWVNFYGFELKGYTSPADFDVPILGVAVIR